MEHGSTVDAVLERIEQGHGTRRGTLSALAREYLRREATGSDASLDPDHAAAAVRGLLELADRRANAPLVVRVFTPSREDYGQDTPGTVLEACLPDQPFVVDTIAEQVRAHGLQPRLTRHPVVGLARDRRHRVSSIEHPDEAAAESLVHIELDQRLGPGAVARLEDDVRGALTDARRVVDDFAALRDRVMAITEAIAAQGDGVAFPEIPHDADGEGDGPSEQPSTSPDEDADEVAAFLRWLAEDNAVLLGAADYWLDDERSAPRGALGLLADDAARRAGREAVDPPAEGTFARLRDAQLISIGHTVALSTVHRRARMEDVAVRGVDDDGRPLLRRVVILVASRAYAAPASETPLLRGVLHRILSDEELLPGSHDWKALVALFDSFPKDELFAMPAADLRRTLMGFVDLAPGQLALRARVAADGRTATVVVAVPRTSYDTAVRDALRDLASTRYGTERVTTHEVLREGDHAYLHLQLYDPEGLQEVDGAKLERSAAQLARSWDDRLRETLIAGHGEEHGAVLAARWAPRLPDHYKAGVDPDAAARDADALEHLTTGGEDLFVALKHETSESDQREDGTAETGAGRSGMTRVAFMVRGDKVELSRAMPILEDLGLHVIEERPTQLRSTEPLWIQDFGVVGPDGRPLDLEACGDRVAAAITAAWQGVAESDSLNRLVTLTPMAHGRLEVLRAYRSYRQRIGSRFTESYQNDVIVQHAAITEKLVRLFELRFGAPSAGAAALSPRDEAGEEALRAEIQADLDEVPLLDHDRILRNQLQLIDATYRTNAYRPGRRALALKLKSAEVPAIPRPTPLWEIYVYGLEVEGIHLRGGMIARGGLRWSDRMDYRTEVMGLMRAQMVKNAVIVPAGAKGGFLVRRPPADPDALRDTVERGYVHFISALLDVTDDRHGDEVVHPDGVRTLDDDDSYMVVAADKGTATFSDTANAVALERGYWLGDAFASGGSVGYDHKALGITARGAWESVKRHFNDGDVDPERDAITAVGIGDMSGDVFGNGMLLSERIRLVAAFDHRHIVIDPDPDAASSYAERRRLFDLPRSSWADYDESLLSTGGGIFSRTLKSIPVSPQMRVALGLDDVVDQMTPPQLLSAILRAPVDLLWNGGIGTYVKATSETHDEVGDKANNAIRVSGAQLRCRCVGEGGNLGFTQLGRIEYALGGGRINTDFIDNSAGVDTSDHEVNIKILLDRVVEQGDLTVAERNALLPTMTDEVASLVLAHNYDQNVSLAGSVHDSVSLLHSHAGWIKRLERSGLLDREIEFLPSEKEIATRRSNGVGLTAPELSVLLAYTKIVLAHELVESGIADDTYFRTLLFRYFPSALRQKYRAAMESHPLRREIIITAIVNEIVNAAGITFFHRLSGETGASAPELARAHAIASEIFDAPAMSGQVAALDNVVDSEVQEDMRGVLQALAERGARWLVNNRRNDDVEASVEYFGTYVQRLVRNLPELFVGRERDAWQERASRLRDSGVPDDVAARLASLGPAYAALTIVDTARRMDVDEMTVASVHFTLGESLELDRLASRVLALPRDDRWRTMARAALRDDLQLVHAGLTTRVLESTDPSAPVQDRVDQWRAAEGAALERAANTLADIWNEDTSDLARLSVGLRVVRTLLT